MDMAINGFVALSVGGVIALVWGLSGGSEKQSWFGTGAGSKSFRPGGYDRRFDLVGAAAGTASPPKPVDPSWGRAGIGFTVGGLSLCLLVTMDSTKSPIGAVLFILTGLGFLYGLEKAFGGVGNLFKPGPGAHEERVRRQKVFGDDDFADSRAAEAWLTDEEPASDEASLDGWRRLGSARPDAIELGLLSERGGGHGHGWLARKMFYGGGKPVNMVVCGANRSGKGSRLLIPNLLQMEGRSVFVIDPKGELAAVTAAYRRTLGKVVVINPFGVLVNEGFPDLASAGFNPLLRLDPASENFDADVRGLAAALIHADGGKEAHWDESAREVVASLITLEVLQAKEYQARGFKDQPSLFRVRERLSERIQAPSEANNFTPGGMIKYAEEMLKTGYPALVHASSRFETAHKERTEVDGIMSTARRQTSLLSDAPIARDLQKPGFDFRVMQHEPVTVYVILPFGKLETYGRWLRLVVTSALQAVMERERAGRVPVLFMLDEFATLGRLDAVMGNWAAVNGLGVQIMPVVQDYSQLKRIYGEGWQTFTSNGVVAAFGGNDMETAAWFEQRSGNRTVVAWGYNQNSGEQSTGRSNTSEGGGLNQQKVPVFPKEKFFNLPKGGLLVTGLSGPVAFARTAAYYERDELKARARENPYYA